MAVLRLLRQYHIQMDVYNGTAHTTHRPIHVEWHSFCLSRGLYLIVIFAECHGIVFHNATAAAAVAVADVLPVIEFFSNRFQTYRCALCDLI